MVKTSAEMRNRKPLLGIISKQWKRRRSRQSTIWQTVSEICIRMWWIGIVEAEKLTFYFFQHLIRHYIYALCTVRSAGKTPLLFNFQQGHFLCYQKAYSIVEKRCYMCVWSSTHGCHSWKRKEEKKNRVTDILCRCPRGNAASRFVSVLGVFRSQKKFQSYSNFERLTMS